MHEFRSPRFRPVWLITRLGMVLSVFLLLPAFPASDLGPPGLVVTPVEQLAGQAPSFYGAVQFKISPWVQTQAASGQTVEFLVVLSQQADLSGAAALPTKLEKGRYVYRTLFETAQATQRPLIAWLQDQRVEYRSFYIVNMVWVKGDAGIVRALAGRGDVARIEGNPVVQGLAPMETQPSGLAPAEVQTGVAPSAPAGIEPNITYVHADQLWNLGFTGQGVVIGNGDTGIQWDHPALKPHYRGWNGSSANHNYNWHDSIHNSGFNPCGNDSPAPCDDFGHGTHTMGTAIGDDGGSNQIGMAPGAKWIGCRNMDHGNGTPARYIECFQFFLAPYPITGTTSDGNPDLAADVTTNSWTCPPIEGCSTNSLEAALQAQQAAGILTVVAAGNAGSNCSTIVDPPSLYGEAYTIGALNTGSDTIAPFSSRGPITADGSNRRKPDITAPGTNVRSSYPTNGYNLLSGTSMATPHVAGAAALLWSAVPGLRGQITLTEQILNDSAVHISSTDCASSAWPNNTFGYGRLDVKAAYDLARLPAGVITGTISTSAGGGHISSATVAVSRDLLNYATTSNSAGLYHQSVLSGTYTVTVSAFGYLTFVHGAVALPSGITVTLPIVLTPAHVNFLPLIAR